MTVLDVVRMLIKMDIKHRYLNMFLVIIGLIYKNLCVQISCKWQYTPSFYEKFKTHISPALIKIQSELGAQNTYRKCADILTLIMGKRTVNNKSRIHRTTNLIGSKIETYISNKMETQETLPQYSGKINDPVVTNKPRNIALHPSQNKEAAHQSARELVLNVDGVHIHDDENRGHNFEAMVAKVYKPENLISVGDSQRSVIVSKHCAGSAKKDKQSTMKERVLEACKHEGFTKDTKVTALSDGAKNCWNIIAFIQSLCCIVYCILDWFHIAKYITTLKGQLDKQHGETLDAAKNELWIGNTTEAMAIIDKLRLVLRKKKHIKKVENFYQYIEDNKNHIVDYSNRQENGLVFTSHVAESTVEHYASARLKKKQKMQWKRANAHGVLQIRAAMISGDWENIWKESGNDFFLKGAA